jgi:hypothetical protein
VDREAHYGDDSSTVGCAGGRAVKVTGAGFRSGSRGGAEGRRTVGIKYHFFYRPNPTDGRNISSVDF